jgi:hypothetical protein
MEIKLTPELKQQFTAFLTQHAPQAFSSALRNLLLEYMAAEVKGGFPLDFNKFIWAMDDLFRLLDTAAEVQQKAIAGHATNKKSGS